MVFLPYNCSKEDSRHDLVRAERSKCKTDNPVDFTIIKNRIGVEVVGVLLFALQLVIQVCLKLINARRADSNQEKVTKRTCARNDSRHGPLNRQHAKRSARWISPPHSESNWSRCRKNFGCLLSNCKPRFKVHKRLSNDGKLIAQEGRSR
jgi:hypothetical protein